MSSAILISSKAYGATLPILYKGRLSDLFVEGEEEAIEQIFDRVFAHLTKDMKDQLKKQYVTKESIAETPSRKNYNNKYRPYRSLYKKYSAQRLQGNDCCNIKRGSSNLQERTR